MAEGGAGSAAGLTSSCGQDTAGSEGEGDVAVADNSLGVAVEVGGGSRVAEEA